MNSKRVYALLSVIGLCGLSYVLSDKSESPQKSTVSPVVKTRSVHDSPNYADNTENSSNQNISHLAATTDTSVPLEQKQSPKVATTPDLIAKGKGGQTIELSNLDKVIEKGDNTATFDTSSIEQLSLPESRVLITSLSERMYNSDSQQILDGVNQTIYHGIELPQDITLDSSACSDLICGIIFSATSSSSAEQAITAFTAAPYVKQHLKGGVLKTFKGDNEYYAMVISAINPDTPITIK